VSIHEPEPVGQEPVGHEPESLVDISDMGTEPSGYSAEKEWHVDDREIIMGEDIAGFFTCWHVSSRRRFF